MHNQKAATSIERNPELAEFLASHAPEIRELAFAAQDLFQELCGPASNFYFDATNAVCAGIGYTHKWQDSFVNTATYATHVTLIHTRFCWLETRRIDHSRILNRRFYNIRFYWGTVL